MVKCCAVVKCANRSNRDKVRFFRFPSIQDRQRKVSQERINRLRRWVAALHREDFSEKKIKNAFICSNHFCTGEPNSHEDHPDYVPSQNMGYESTLSKRNVFKFERAIQRRLQQRTPKNIPVPEAVPILLEQGNENEEEIRPQNALVSSQNKTTQTDLNICMIETELLNLQRELIDMREKVSSGSFTEAGLVGNNKKTLFLTGVPNYESLKIIYNLVEPYISSHLNTISEKFQHFLITLMRLRLGISFRFLSYIFNCSEHLISRIFFSTVHVLYMRLKCFIQWPSREELVNTMPISFIEHFKRKVTVIIDCFEIFIEKPSNLDAQACTWSNYKHHNTLKYLIGIAPYGAITFISSGYGGRISDKLLTEDCGFLEQLQPGDLILADRGFLIEDLVGFQLATVKTPAFLKGKAQLDPIQLEETRNIASVRIHVERVIGSLRQKFKILHSVLPLSLVRRKDADNIPVLDKIVTICCALINNVPSMVTVD